MNWAPIRVRYVCDLNPRIPAWIDANPDLEVSFLPMDSIGDDGTLRLDQKRRVQDVRNGYSFFQDGDIAIAKVTPCFENGKAAVLEGLTEGTGFGTTEITVVRPRADVDRRFLFYVLTEDRFKQSGKASMTGAGGLKRVPDAFLKKHQFGLPSLREQRKVVEFLDHETTKIDELIAKQERLIGLLAEKRQAIISQAVTKGLDPSVPTRPSGIPWVPASPVHWTASRIKWTHPRQNSGTSVNGADVPAGPGEIGVLKTGAVSRGYFLPSSNKTVVPEDVDRATCPVRGGTLIVNRANTPDLVGSTGVPETDIPTLFLSDKLWQIEFKEANARFMYWWTKTDGYRSQIQFRRVGASSSMQNLSYSDFLTVDLAVPSLSEQGEIAQYLDARTNQLDALATKAKEAISLLRERRSALISAAVTGKIDVRGEVA